MTKKSSLTPSRQRLVERMQEINFGRIENLLIRDREPRWNPPPRILREVVLSKEGGCRPERSKTDFALKGTLRDLFRHFDRLETPARISIAVQNGLPVRLTIEDVTEA